MTGKWHEVEGDEAAIEILGEDTFHNGPKEIRQTRQLYDSDAAARAEESFISTLTRGLEGRDLTAEGFGTGGKGRVVEREGILGEDLGEWKDVERGHIFGREKEDEGVL